MNSPQSKKPTLIANNSERRLVIMVETRYWPRIGLRVTKEMALQFAERMDGKASFYDDEMEEFVMTENDIGSANNEVEVLFSNPDDSEEVADSKQTVILKSMELHNQRRKRIIKYRKEVKKGFVWENEETFVEALKEEGESEEKIAELLTIEIKKAQDEAVNLKYQEWFESEVIALQKEYGTYKEPSPLLDDEEE
jgi:hypothetical protein